MKSDDNVDLEYIACCGTDVGMYRKINEDAVSVKVQTIKGRKHYMAILCDGVGGLAKGEYASSSMRERLEQWFFYEYPQISKNEDADKIIMERLRKVVQIQNNILYEYGKKQGIRCATTVSTLLLTPERYYIAHVGDSRVYGIDGIVRQITEDQTLVAREVKQGIITKKEAERDVRQHVILQSVGADRYVDMLTYTGVLSKKLNFVVCTDGFYHHITDQELLHIFYKNEYENSNELGNEISSLINILKGRGERDNISVAAILHRKEALM